jgi:Uma2 family endonuclease
MLRLNVWYTPAWLEMEEAVMGPLARKLGERFTYGDYLSWDDGERWELIDGVPYNMSPAPLVAHQRILGELHLEFGTWLKGKRCKVFLAPFDVRLPESDESDDLVDTVVQPDLAIICDKEKLDKAGCRGAPDLIVEILSPGTAHKDLKVKLDSYERAGVREYWIVDPAEGTVMVFTQGADRRYGRPEVYGDGDVVRVAIFPDLQISLATVFAE